MNTKQELSERNGRFKECVQICDSFRNVMINNVIEKNSLNYFKTRNEMKNEYIDQYESCLKKCFLKE